MLLSRPASTPFSETLTALTPGTAAIRSISRRVELDGPLPGIARGVRVHVEDDEMLRREAQIDLAQVGDGAQEQRRADQQHQRHRDLPDDEHRAQPVARTPARVARDK